MERAHTDPRAPAGNVPPEATEDPRDRDTPAEQAAKGEKRLDGGAEPAPARD